MANSSSRYGLPMGRGWDPQYLALSSMAPEASHWILRKIIILGLSFPFDRWENCGPEEEHGQLKYTWPVTTRILIPGPLDIALMWVFPLCYINLNPNSCFIGFVSPSLIRWKIQAFSGGWVEEYFSVRNFNLKHISHVLILSRHVPAAKIISSFCYNHSSVWKLRLRRIKWYTFYPFSPHFSISKCLFPFKEMKLSFHLCVGTVEKESEKEEDFSQIGIQPASIPCLLDDIRRKVCSS